MRAYDGWWGGKPDWDAITLRFIPDDAARVAALLSGQVNLIDSVPPINALQLGRDKRVGLFSRATNRIIYLAMDSAREDSPFVTGPDGAKLPHNPLRDVRVRHALSAMINRELITTRLLDDAAVPAGQIVPEGEGGYDPALTPTPFDPKAARALLAQAGYPKGFGLTIHSSSDRYPNDAQVAEAVGQMFARGGIHVNGVEALPYNVFAPAATARKYSVFLFGWASSTGNSSEALRSILATYDPANGLGALNRVRYSNPRIRQAARRGDGGVRRDEAQRAARAGDCGRDARLRAAAALLGEGGLGGARRRALRRQRERGLLGAVRPSGRRVTRRPVVLP